MRSAKGLDSKLGFVVKMSRTESESKSVNHGVSDDQFHLNSPFS